MNFLKKLFNRKPIQNLKIQSRKVKDLDIFDTVWVLDNGELFDGWIFDVTRRAVIVLYDSGLKDFRFRTEKLGDQTEINQDNKTLYCNKPKL